MAIIDFPSGIALSYERPPYCDLKAEFQRFVSSRSGISLRTQRGPKRWEQAFTTITYQESERTLQRFIDQIGERLETVRAPDFLAEIDHGALPLRPGVFPYFEELFFTPSFAQTSPLIVTVDGNYSRGEKVVAVEASQSSVNLKASRRVQVGNGFYRLTEDVILGDDGTGSLNINPGLRTDISDGQTVVVTNAKAVWEVVDVTTPDQIGPGIYARDWTLIEDLRIARSAPA